MAKHTPGPWTVSGMAIRGPFTPKGREALGVVVANVIHSNRPRCEADAHLIAAAPELLKALKALAHPPILRGDSALMLCFCDVALGNPMSTTHSSACLTASAAVLKAEGR